MKQELFNKLFSIVEILETTFLDFVNYHIGELHYKCMKVQLTVSAIKVNIIHIHIRERF